MSRAPPLSGISSVNTFNIHAPVGAIQTGPGAVANVHGAFEPGAQTALLQVLNTAIGAITTAPAGTLATSELLVVAAEASEIIGSPNPDRSKLRQTWDILSSAVQGIASAPQAYQAMVGALAVFQ